MSYLCDDLGGAYNNFHVKQLLLWFIKNFMVYEMVGQILPTQM